MERPLWDRIQELYSSCLRLPRFERSAFLATACNGDSLLMREVKALLDADDSASGFLEAPVFELGLRVISSSGQNHSNGDASFRDESLDGTTIDGKYLVEKELVRGGMGKVYFARDTTLHDRPVVIKVLSEASLENAYVVKKFEQEVEALARIDHPNIVGVLGAGKCPDGKPYIAMQYVEGATLRSQIPTEGMNLDRIAAILKQLGAALEYVHERGILHRDLKPENILLQFFRGGEELVKVVDFGIAKVKDSVVASSTASNVPVGTFQYMSPEQLRGHDPITKATDVYSLAVIAYEMITGRRPFNASSAPELLELQRGGVRLNPVDLRPTLSTEARAILLRALSFDPAARYQSAAEFGDRLARTLTSTNPRAALKGSLTRRRLKFVFGSLVIALLGLTLFIYFSTRKPGTPEPQNQVTGPLPAPSPSRSFTYWLNVQKMRNGKPYQQAFLSSGKETFETGYKFRLNVSSSDPGYLYLFNEGPPSRSGTSFTILYPTPLTNKGSASLGANQVVQTGWNEFAGQAGAENFWIVWSISVVPELEAARDEAFKNPHGALTGENLVATKKFLVEKESEIKTKYTTNRELHQTTVKGNSDLLIKMVEFEHR